MLSLIMAVALLAGLCFAAKLSHMTYTRVLLSALRKKNNLLGRPVAPGENVDEEDLDGGHVPSLLDISLHQLARLLQTRSLTCVTLVKAYLHRIEEVAHEYHAVIQTNPDALEIARALDAERREMGPRGPLHGIPILLKDNVVTLDRMDSTCGSYALVGARAARESGVVTALRKAGAVVLGKTNLAQWAGFRSTSGCSGWSARGGQCTGPYVRGMKASGSSSGSAVATALGLACAAVGTETGYSIVSPAERAGVVGFKPTRNLISSEGLIFASERLDTVGLLTRSVLDASIILQEIIRHSGDGAVSHALEQSCSSTNLRGLRIGIPSNIADLTNLHPSRQIAFTKALHVLKAAGAKIVHGIDMLGAKEFEDLPPAAKSILLDTDLKFGIDSYLSSLVVNPQNMHSLEDLIAFTKSHPKEEYPSRNVAVLERALDADPENQLYVDMLAKEAWFAGEGGIAGALERHRLSILLAPSLSPTLNTFAAKAGSPCMSMPMGKYPAETKVTLDPGNGLVNVAPGIPFSMYMYGGVGGDADVLNLGYAYEQLARVREELEMYLVPKTEVRDVAC